jgi:hypothetical protein
MTPENLKILRDSTGLSIEKAARLVWIAGRSWARYEDGSRPIPDGIVELFCLKNNIKYPPLGE